MPDFSTTLQDSVESRRQFLQRIGACTPDVEQRLENLQEVNKILSGLIQETVAHIDQQWLNLVISLCKTLLFGDAMKLMITLACHSNFFNEVEESQKADETSKLPPRMQKRVEEITGYLKKCQVISNTIDKTTHSLIEQVRKAINTDFKEISVKDRKTLEMDVDTLESELKLVKIYLDSAQAAFNELKSDAEAEKTSYGIKVALVVTGVGATLMIGGVAFQPAISLIPKLPMFRQYILGELGTAKLAALGIGLTSGAIFTFLFIYNKIHSHGKMLDDEVKMVEIDLKRAETEYNVQETRFNERVKKYMNR